MPRITGPDIATHVAQQEAAVVRAAVGLFAERGYTAVTLADIATEVGLARTSLYRYFPDKDHILLAWLRTEIDGLIERSQAIAAAERPAIERLTSWFHLQLDYLDDPEHQVFATIAATMGTLGPAVRAELTTQHQRLYATVETIVADALSTSSTAARPGRRDPAVVAALVIGLFRAAGDALARGGDRAVIGPELDRSAAALLSA
ncbi:MAG TPA: helix-turn-helix domain-containing protein [Acidimicrobiales bacterium]|nr:helix-turn-helix domain-containing protein [Acidimicrobiales bacterium]